MAQINQYLDGARVTFPTPFLPTGQAPLDIRQIVEKKEDLKVESFYEGEAPYWYLGMVVSCLEDSKLYILKEINSVPTFCEITAESDIKGVDSNDKILSSNGGYISSTLGLEVRPLEETDEGYDPQDKNDYIILKGKDGKIISKVDASRFVKDGMIDSVEWSTEPGKENYLVITWNTDSDKSPQQTEINFGKFIDTWTHRGATKGIAVEDDKYVGVVDPDSEKYLTVGENGFKIEGIDAINEQVQTHETSIIEIYNHLNWSEGSFSEQ